MISRCTLLVATLLPSFFASSAFALSAEVINIFNKSNRALPPPPKTLRADSLSWDHRISTGNERADEVDKKYKDLTVSTESIEEQAEETDWRERTSPAHEFSGERVFGIGLVGMGAYGIFGAEFDFGLNSEWSAGFGLGTGMTYSTWGVHGRYFLQEGTLSPFVQVGYANWHVRRISQTGEKVQPTHLAERFFEDSSGVIRSAKTVHLLYPGIGILYQSKSGLASSLQLQYFVHMKGFEGGLWGAFGMYYYF